MKKMPKKLELRSSVVRVLQSNELGRVVGGGSTSGQDSVMTCSTTFLNSCACPTQETCATECGCGW